MFPLYRKDFFFSPLYWISCKAVQHFPHVSSVRWEQQLLEILPTNIYKHNIFHYTHPSQLSKHFPLCHVIFTTTKQKRRKPIFPMNGVTEAQMGGFSYFWCHCLFHHWPWALFPGCVHHHHTYCSAANVALVCSVSLISCSWQKFLV